MKLQLKKVAAVTLAMSMCLPCMAYADETNRATIDSANPADKDKFSGKFETSFGTYSPAIKVSVPVKAGIKVNRLAEDDASTSGEVTVGDLTVASNSIDVINVSMDGDDGVKVNVTVQATIKKAGKGVVQAYNDFEPVAGSTQKKIHLDLAEAKTAASADGTTEAKYDLTDTNVNKATITKYGSLLSVDIDEPTKTGDVVNATVGSFAVLGTANTNAEWQADDIGVDITYKIKASKALNIKTPTLAAVEVTAGQELSATLTGIGEAKVTALGAHNDEEGKYGDYLWEAKAFTVEYPLNSPGTAVIKIKGTDAGLAVLAKDGYKNEKQDFIVGLSDGRMVVTTLTVK